MAEQFRIADLEFLAIGDEQVLVRAKGGGAPVVLTENDARMLAGCTAHRTLEDHGRAWASQLDRQKIQQVEERAPRWLARVLDAGAKAAEPSGKQVARAVEKLRGFAERGLLLSRSTFHAETLAHADDEPSQPIAALGFTTRRRPVELRRALESYAANFRRHGRAPEILVVEDSRDPQAEQETERLLREVQAETDLSIRFAGLAEREAFADALAHEARVSPAIARFALLGDERCTVTTGAARNSVLLDCASLRYVLADDDGLCRMARTPGAEEGVDLASQNDPTQFWFFESRDRLHEQVTFTDEPDLFGLHETLLGRSIGAIGALDPAGASPALEARLRRLGGTISTTMAGVVGDSGLASTAYLHLEPRSRARLTGSEEFYRAAVANRQMLRGPQRAVLSDGFLTMAGNLGIDARGLFPPFPPVQRNSDGIVGRLLQGCFPRSCRGYLNWAVLHDPIGARAQSLDRWFEDLRSIRFADVLAVLLRDALELGFEDPKTALRAAGERLSLLGALPLEAFREELRAGVLQREASRLAHARRMAREEGPAFYQKLQERYTTVLQEALTQETLLQPRDLPEGSLSLAQSLTGRIGALLQVWPQLFDAALWMRTSGRRLTRAVR